jgi:hypothetical protein
MMQAQITHITKDDFFSAFRTAFFTAITESNILVVLEVLELFPLTLRG